MAIPFLGTAAGEVVGPISGTMGGAAGRSATKCLLNAAGVKNRATRDVCKFVGTAVGHAATSYAAKAACHAATLDAVGASTALPTVSAASSIGGGLTHATFKTLPKHDQARLSALNVMRHLQG